MRSPAPARRLDPVRVTRPMRIAGRAGRIAATSAAAQTFARVRRDPELAERWEARTAQQIAQSLGDLRGAVMKLGQMASYVDARIPASIRASLEVLQADAPRMAPELSAAVIEAELGRPPAEVFAHWDPSPIAAASIGQVHRALTLDGRAVAVKVQFPDIDRSIAADLGAIRPLLLPLRAFAPNLDIAAIAAEVRERVSEELDYRREAANQRAFAEAFAGHPHLTIPAVHDELSTGRVLVTDLAPGAPLAEARTWSAGERDRAGETVYRFVVTSIYELGMVHGDLHPGNLRFDGAGRVTVLDFGLVRRFSPRTLELLAASVRSCLEGADAADLVAQLVELGHFPAGCTVDEATVSAYFASFYDLIRDDAPRTVAPADTSGLVDACLAARFDPVRREGALPSETIFLHRLNLGLHAVLAELGATANWRRISQEAWPWDRRPAPGPLGDAHDAWRSSSDPDHRPTTS